MGDGLVLGNCSPPASPAISLRFGNPKGKKSMEWTADNQPAVFFATRARLIPNDVRVTVEQQLPGNLSMENWTIMREIVAAVRQAISDASSKPQVLEFVLEALRVAEAKTYLLWATEGMENS